MDEKVKIISDTFSFWDHMDESEKKELLDATYKTTYLAGESIHSGNVNCTGVIIVTSGELRSYMLSEDGREITLYRLVSGEVCILSAACVLDTITFEVFIDADVDTDVYIINSGVFNRLVKKNIYIEAYCYKEATRRFSDVMWTMEQILFMNVDRRLAICLLDLSDESGEKRINKTQEQIAQTIGSAREVVSRMLKYFSKEHLVKLYRGGVEILDYDGMRQLADNG